MVVGTEDVYRDNLLQVEVYFEEFNYKKIKEYPAYLVTMIQIQYFNIIVLLPVTGLELSDKTISSFGFREARTFAAFLVGNI